MDAAPKTSPASYGQRRLWFIDRLRPRSPLYNMHQILPVAGLLDLAAMQSALTEMIRRHEVLRTRFAAVDGQPVQVVLPPFAPFAPLIDLSLRPEEQRGAAFQRLADDDKARAFDLERGPLLNLMLVRLAPQQHFLMLCIHHIVFDDWSMDIFIREVFSLYEDFKAGRPASLAAPPMQYAEYATAQRAQFTKAALDPQLAYWRQRLRNLPVTTELPTDRSRPPVQSFPGSLRNFNIAPDAANRFRELTRASGATLFMSLFAAYAVLLSRYSGQLTLAVGTPVANRNKPELANLIGFLVNTLVLRIDLDDDPGFLELLARSREMASGALANQDVPFELLVEDLRPERDASRQPMFQTMFVFQFGRSGDEGSRPSEEFSSGAKFDLTLTVVDADPHIRIAFDYNTDLFEPATIERLAAGYERLLQSIVANPYRPLSRLDLLGDDERRRIQDIGAGPVVVRAAADCVQDRFAAMAAAAPQAIAIAYGTSLLTYASVDLAADALAARLMRLGVGPERTVGLCLDRTPDWIIAMLAVLKAGGAIAPLDPSLPPARIAYMVADAEIELVLTLRAKAGVLAGSLAQIFYLDEASESRRADAPSAEGPEVASPCAAVAARLAYVIYTSGSTGKPKGVAVTHEGLANLAEAQGSRWGIGPGSRTLQFAAAGFDASLSEVFVALSRGGALCLAPADELMPGPPLLATLRNRCITHVTLPPSALAAMEPEALPDLRVIVSAGEPCEPGLARRWGQGRRLFNAYGPTEITICATMYADNGSSETLPIGRPIDNMTVRVVDRHGAPTPIGVAGEIVVGGVGVARGYLNQPELTAAQFVADDAGARPGARLYRTGDLGRFDAAGNLHYLGRADGQLKIRGYRIEPGEIESVLRLHPQVRDAVALGLGVGPESRLIAYVVAKGTPPLAIELRSFLALHLPDYMRPAAYVMLPEWPKTINGKIDRQALPRPDALARDVGAVFVGPATDLEQTIAAIWRECLGVAEIGANDNFFDLGGHSLLLVRVHDRLREQFKVDLSLTDLFRFPTIALLAANLKARAPAPVAGEAATRPVAPKATDVGADSRAAMQNAARLQRRNRGGGNRNV